MCSTSRYLGHREEKSLEWKGVLSRIFDLRSGLSYFGLSVVVVVLFSLAYH
jgi:hypothetical protein